MLYAMQCNAMQCNALRLAKPCRISFWCLHSAYTGCSVWGFISVKRLGFQGLLSGGRTRIRTLDPLIKSQLLYQLSYAPHFTRKNIPTVQDKPDTS
jgi:hypothetical protein